MSGSTADSRERVTAIHEMLLRLAGKLPDDLLARSREWLAAGQQGNVGRAVAHAVLAQSIPLPQADLAILRALVVAAGTDPAVVASVEIGDFDPAPPYAFTAGRPDTDDLVDDSVPSDAVDQAAVEAVSDEARAHGLWRVWRAPAVETPWPPPRRVFVIEVDQDANAAEVAGRVQARLEAAGELTPQVEVFGVGSELPAYQRLARAYGVLLWARTPQPDIKIAVVFDEVDALTGPCFTAGHPRMQDEGEARRVIDYLRGGAPLLVTTARMDDVVDTSRTAVVPMSFRTDGTWIWTDTTTYYLEQHRLEPDPELLAHIRDAAYLLPELDSVAIDRAMTVLQAPPEEEPVWTYGATPNSDQDETT